MQILSPSHQDISAIIALAKQTWQATYSSIISQEQINYMLNLFYNATLIESQLANPSHYFLAVKEENELLGYAHCYEENSHFKLSKLYVIPSTHKKGVGKILIQAIEKEAILRGYDAVYLNVNRANPAYYFYLKMGYFVVETVDIPLEKFWLNDYIMKKEMV